MARKLTNDDGRMVDMLLNGGGAAMENPPLTQVFSNPRPEMFEMRLESVEKVLSLLDLMPASDPPADLISRTMDRIEEANLTGDGLATRPSRASAPTQRPQA